MKIGLVCPEATGHLNPLTSLGLELRRRGHDVTVVGGICPGTTPRRGLGYVALGDESGLATAVDQGWKELGRLSGLPSMWHTGKVLGLSARMILSDLPQAIEQHSFDGLVVDQLSPAALVVAEACGVPCVIACNALAMIYDPHVPPPALPWGYRRDAWGYLRNQAAKCLLVPVYEWLADARRLGVKPLTLVFDSSRGLAQIAQQPAFFDFPNASLPDHFHYTAPWHEAARDDDVDFPWDRLDDRPLVYASMGTLQNNQRRVFAAIAAALRDLPVQAVLTTGGATDGPNDQPGVAKRVEWLGLGEMLPVRQATSDRIRALVERVSGDANYTERARQIRASFPRYPA